VIRHDRQVSTGSSSSVKRRPGASRGLDAAERSDGIVAMFWYPITMSSRAKAGTAMAGRNHANHSRFLGAGEAAGEVAMFGNCTLAASTNAASARRSSAHS